MSEGTERTIGDTPDGDTYEEELAVHPLTYVQKLQAVSDQSREIPIEVVPDLTNFMEDGSAGILRLAEDQNEEFVRQARRYWATALGMGAPAASQTEQRRGDKHPSRRKKPEEHTFRCHRC